MRFDITLPTNCDAMLLDIRRDEGDKVRIGDILFSYQADGALLFEYSAYNGTVVSVPGIVGESGGGEAVMVIDGELPPRDAEMFPS